MSVNKAFILGNLGKDPEVRFGASGTPVCNFSVATTRSWKDKDGKKQEETEWHNVVVFDKLAEACGEYLKKGSKVFVEGRIKNDKWEKDGVAHHATKIYAVSVQFLDAKKKENAEAEKPPSENEDVP